MHRNVDKKFHPDMDLFNNIFFWFNIYKMGILFEAGLQKLLEEDVVFFEQVLPVIEQEFDLMGNLKVQEAILKYREIMAVHDQAIDMKKNGMVYVE